VDLGFLEQKIFLVALFGVSFVVIVILWNILDIWISYQLRRHMSFLGFIYVLTNNFLGNIIAHIRLSPYYRTFYEVKAMEMAATQHWEILGMSKSGRYYKLKRVKGKA
jgi:hypothetical protein